MNIKRTTSQLTKCMQLYRKKIGQVGSYSIKLF